MDMQHLLGGEVKKSKPGLPIFYSDPAPSFFSPAAATA
jgi:hypothetical protein